MTLSKKTLEKLANVVNWYEDNDPKTLQEFRERTTRVMGYIDSLNKVAEVDCSEQTKTEVDE